MAAPVLGPVHPDYVARLDPEYVAFHNAHLTEIPVMHKIPWDPACRLRPLAPGNTAPLPVSSIKDIALSNSAIRVFTPEGVAPAAGWPVILFMHGGGWTLGSINSENSFCTNMCARANCVVISLDYRLAPENPYPAAVDDTMEALEWIYNKGAAEIGVNPNKIAVGGSSSGGNLAAIAALKAAEMQPPIPLVFQLLIVPVTDNTASVENNKSWKENENTPWLDTGRMIWFKNNYLPNAADWTKWDASPIFAPDELFAKQPPAYIACMECDILREEAIVYGKKLRDAGVKVHVEVYPGAPHQIMVLDGALAVGKKLVTDCANALREAFA